MPSLQPPKFAGAALTKELKKLAVEVVEMEDDGNALTREQKLARMIWQQALGWTEVVRDDSGNRKEIKHPPVAWCQQFLFERVEGKAAPAREAEGEKISAADKVRELSRDRINNLIGAK